MKRKLTPYRRYRCMCLGGLCSIFCTSNEECKYMYETRCCKDCSYLLDRFYLPIRGYQFGKVPLTERVYKCKCEEHECTIACKNWELCFTGCCKKCDKYGGGFGR